MHFFITGHTGFKGSWLTLLLKELGHEVSGFSLPPVSDGLFNRAQLVDVLKFHRIGDIRNYSQVLEAMSEAQADFAIHLAAQPLVLQSYRDPVETFQVNVDGTLNFLNAILEQKRPPVSLVVTTDKVYKDTGHSPYLESDPLGGLDPYSASKAMADMLAQSWSHTHPQLNLRIARAGNVIGPYDVSPNRLIPDFVKAVETGCSLTIRNPMAIRPWQNVIDCVYGYYLFMIKAHSNPTTPKILNFGPNPGSFSSVDEVVQIACRILGARSPRIEFEASTLKETSTLTLDSNLAEETLGWLNLSGLERTIEFALSSIGETSPLKNCNTFIRDYLSECS